MRRGIKVDRKKKKINISLFILLILGLIFLGYTCFKKFLLEEIKPQTTNVSEDENEDTKSVEDDTVDDIDEVIIVDTQTSQRPNSVDTYTEESPVIDGQQAYIVAPTDIYTDDPATIVIYSHGSTGVITDDFTSEYMSQLRDFALHFPPYKYIFAASNQHGDSAGNPDSIQDTINMINWIKNRYPVKEKYLFIGFSRGGLVTMNFATMYPETVSKIALLAPTLRLSEWDTKRFPIIKDMDIKIWHGTDDINVRYSNTLSFLDAISEYDITIPLVTLEGKTHFDVDREYVKDILEFFNS
jgi:alpha/beta superfamily hydrolase